MRLPACCAARFGAIGGSKQYGLTRSMCARTLEASMSAATSSLARSGASVRQPVATGFMPTARRPERANARNRAEATSVLPTPVSVPVTKKPRLATLDGLPDKAAASARLDVDHRPAGRTHAWQRLPRMPIDDFECRRQARVLSKRFVALLDFLQSAFAGQGMVASGRDVVRADRLEVTHQGSYLGVGQGQVLHIHHRIDEPGADHHVADVVHIDEAVDVDPAVAGAGRAQFFQRVGSERGKHQQTARPQYALALHKDRWQVVGPLESKIGPNQVHAGGPDGQLPIVAADE